MMDLQPKHWVRLQLLAVAGAVLLAGVGVAAYFQNANVSARRDGVVRTNRLIADLNQFSNMLTDMETGQRGYFLTGDDDYLEPYAQARRQLPIIVKKIEVEVQADAPELMSAFLRLQASVADRGLEIERTFEAERTQGREAALEAIRSDVGRYLMDAVRADLGSLRDAVERKGARIQEQIGRMVYRSNLLMASLILLAMLSALLSAVLTRRYTAAYLRARKEGRRADRASAESQEKSIFLANMSHEIRTPMNAIFGFAQLLGDTVTGERERAYAEAITQSGQVLLGLINDILDISKIEAGKLPLVLQATSPVEILRTCETLFSRMASDKGLRLVIEADPDLPEAVLLDPLRMRQILINLIGNAIRYTDTGSVTVRAVASQPDGIEGSTVELRIEVIDSGVGIPPERIDSVFDPFTQLDSARASGTGLGLSIVRHLVTLMGGRIEVDSTPGIGSRFVVVLPELPVAEPATADGVDVLSADERVLDSLPPMSVLAVDDVALNRSLIEAWLAETHHQVRTAGSGPEGIERALSERPDVILMDIRMPGMDGVEALRQIRRLPELDATKVIALTASSLLGEEGRLRELFDGYLRKPVSRNSLGQELARLLDGAIDAGSRSGDAAEAAAEIDDDDARAWSEHAAAIHAALAGARGTMSTDEVRQVLKSIAGLPPTPAFRELSLLADEIRRAVDIFDIVTLESALSRCADTVQRLDQAARLIEA